MAENYVGTEIISAERHFPGGLISPHVELNCMQRVFGKEPQYSVYFRGKFDRGRGVVPIPEENRFDYNYNDNPRGWTNISVICENKSPEEARDIALAEAKRRNVVLWEDGSEGERYVKRITWHPDNWSPEQVFDSC